MKKWLAVVIYLFMIVMVLAAFILTSSPKPPNVTVTAGNVGLATKLGTYCWENFSQAVCVDSIAPHEIVSHFQMEPTLVNAGETISIQFKKQPQSIQVSQWIKNYDYKKIAEATSFTAPTEAGIYIYNILAHWKKGDGSYVFTIEVK